jgi:hypothetical protein
MSPELTLISGDLAWHKLHGDPGSAWWGAEFGGVSIQLDMTSRTAEVQLAAGGESTADDIEQAIRQLAGRGLKFPDQFRARYADSGVIVFTATF